MSAPGSSPPQPLVPPGFRDAPGHDVWLVFVVVGFVICVIGAAATARIDAIGWCIGFCVVGALAALDVVGTVWWKRHRGQ